MRKRHQQEILELINTIQEAHEAIKIHMERKEYPQAQDMLAQCQECAVSIGNSIEKLEGEEFITVSYVQDYCDAIYHVYETLNQITQSINELKYYKMLRKALLKIENSIKNDIHIKKEIAFFPYKASMWDSLESVYLKAKEDPDIDAYCVPIPYYDLNPDRSFRQMHYEGLEYPKNIEVIDYKTYNFEERQPDVIYIHNPYDSWNLVTSVEPRFYSSNLKKYTEELVYIPYFVLQEIEPDNQAAIDGMSHFITTPGVFNADKVIVQSEKMKQIYVNEYLKAAKEMNLNDSHQSREFVEKKILGLGSPKFDKVKNTKKEDLEIPEEWLKIIQKPDGSWKKIIFYNTGISALLQYGEKWVAKIEDSLKVFRENKDMVTILWRPHPLIENTMKSMKPQVMCKYLQVKNLYIQEGWGIYDDSTELNRAIAISDAFYGDDSSVVQLFKSACKSVLLQFPEFITTKCNMKALQDIYRLQIFAANILFEEKYAWFWGTEFKKLFQIDMTDNRIYPIDLPDELRFDSKAFALIKNKTDIFMFPNYGSCGIKIYELNKKTYQSIDFQNDYYDGKELIFTEIFERRGSYFAAEHTTNTIIEIDIEQNKMVGIYQLQNIDSMCYMTIRVGNRILCTSQNKPCVASFDMCTKYTEYIELDNINSSICLLIEVNQEIWVVCKDKKIYVYDIELKNCKEILELPKELGAYREEDGEIRLLTEPDQCKETILFQQGVSYQDSIWLIPTYANSFIYINAKTKEICIIRDKRTNQNHLATRYAFEGVWLDKYAFLYSIESGKRLIIDMCKGEIDECMFGMNEHELTRLVDNHITNNVISENQSYHHWNLQNLIDYI